jgi:hypothetical protein
LARAVVFAADGPVNETFVGMKPCGACGYELSRRESNISSSTATARTTLAGM